MVLDTRTVDYLWHIFNKSLNSTGGMNTKDNCCIDDGVGVKVFNWLNVKAIA